MTTDVQQLIAEFRKYVEETSNEGGLPFGIEAECTPFLTQSDVNQWEQAIADAWQAITAAELLFAEPGGVVMGPRVLSLIRHADYHWPKPIGLQAVERGVFLARGGHAPGAPCDYPGEVDYFDGVQEFDPPLYGPGQTKSAPETQRRIAEREAVLPPTVLMERSIAALALELDTEVWGDVRDKWHATRDEWLAVDKKNLSDMAELVLATRRLRRAIGEQTEAAKKWRNRFNNQRWKYKRLLRIVGLTVQDEDKVFRGEKEPPLCPGMQMKGKHHESTLINEYGIQCVVCGVMFSYGLTNGINPPHHLAAVTAQDLG